MIHATAISIGGRCVLITGASGAGKSDLALRLIDRGAALIADDQTHLAVAGNRLIASAPATIIGKMEIRGVGIVALPHAQGVPVALFADLDSRPDRLPMPGTQDLRGIAIPVIALDPFEASAPLKVEHALTAFGLPLEAAASR